MSKTVVKGIVEKIVGPGTSGIYALYVDNVRYGCYKTSPACNVGDSVAFEATQKGDFWNLDLKTLRVTEAQASGNVANQSATRTKAWVPDEKRQDTISYQSARKDALELCSILASKDLIDFGKAKTNASKIDVMEVFVDKYTQRFFEDTKNLGHTSASTEAMDAADADSTGEYNDRPY